jgi:beta-mannosidase
MKRYNLSNLEWTLKGYMPDSWRSSETFAYDPSRFAEVAAIPVKVPGSVQKALLDAGLIPDWNVGMNYRLCQWAEHLDWVFEARIPDEWFSSGNRLCLNFHGLDYKGDVYINSKNIGSFCGSFTPWEFDISSFAGTKDNRLSVVFQRHPDWLGQIAFTSQIKEWKPRFYYSWDWVVRLVQTGIWDEVFLESADDCFIDRLDIATDVDEGTGKGILHFGGKVECGPPSLKLRRVKMQPSFVTQGVTSEGENTKGGVNEDLFIELSIKDGEGVVLQETFGLKEWEKGIVIKDLDVKTWWPNGHGDQPLYSLKCRLVDASGRCIDEQARRIGFKHVEWKQCRNAPENADPWICCVNGKPIFLQGVNWTPIKPNFADVTEDDIRKRLELYRDLGLNILRVWGGAVLEGEIFYAMCDELGLMVWQELPLSSSGHDNWPPEDEKSIEDMCRIAESYAKRRRHHASLLMWCGGNELQGNLEGGKTGCGKPIDLSHPMMARVSEIMDRIDPVHRFIPTSSLGPVFYANPENFGKGLHWDVHGPWKIPGDYQTTWIEYWEKDDSLFRSETGCPGASSVSLMDRYKGDSDLLPVNTGNPMWARTAWWIEEDAFERETGRKPETIGEYVGWSQDRQRKALEFAVKKTKERFPSVGGIILWMGHDCFPCAANTSIIDFEGNPKPSALAVGKVFCTGNAEKL